MTRRSFMTLLSAVLAAPFGAVAQERSRYVVGCLTIGEPTARLEGWRKALDEAGFVEGRNLAVEFRWADSANQLPALAAELVDRRVDLIFAVSGLVARAAKAATSSIPIVFAGAVDPVGLGLMGSLQQPGGNITGVANLFEGLAEKRLQLLHEIVPTASRIGYLVNPENPNPANRADRIAAAGRTLGIEIIALPAAKPDDIEPAVAAGGQAGIGGIVIADDPIFNGRQGQVAELAARYALPTITNVVGGGGLISYGPDFQDIAYKAGTYVGRVLKGEKPANLPVMQPTKFELVINLKTAKALGLAVPQWILARADEVIE